MMAPAAVVYAAAGLFLAVTLLPISHNPHWLIRCLDFPRLQFSVLGLLILSAEFVLLDLRQPVSWMVITSTLSCSLWQLWWILPYTSIWPTEVRDATANDAASRISILTANVLTPNRQANKLLDLVEKHQPDVLVTLESNGWWEQQLAGLESTMPHTIKCPLENLYGMHVYSRLPVSDAHIEFLVEDDVPSMHALFKLPCGADLRAHFLHPAPPSPTENAESAERDAELIIVARSVRKTDAPVIVTGDLNDVAWSGTTRLFRKLSGLLDPRVGRGMYNTFHADYPLLRWPLDHLFHSAHFTLVSIERLPSIGSDHFALLTVLAFTPDQGTGQSGPDANREDRLRGQAIAENMDVDVSQVPTPGL